MAKSKIIIFTFLLFSALTSFSPYYTGIEKLSATLISRQVQNGQSVTIKGEIFYQRNGNLTTHFTYPKEYILLANSLGETKVYDPLKNTVLQYQNFLFSTQTSQFYYFFSGKTYDMGLTNIGYVQEKTYYDNNLLVTEWKLKKSDTKALIQKIKLVFDNQKPVYMDYRNLSDKIIRKVYYYNYTHLQEYDFPSVTTEIIYNDKDSTVTKTSYDNFKVNEQTNSPYFNYSIPPNAKSE